jgi:hypothetical protein
MSDMVREGNGRILAATHEVNPAGCPVRDGHPRMHSECAICGQQPRPALNVSDLANRPGDWAWQVRVMNATMAGDADEVERLTQQLDNHLPKEEQ